MNKTVIEISCFRNGCACKTRRYHVCKLTNALSVEAGGVVVEVGCWVTREQIDELCANPNIDVVIGLSADFI
jgi:hypothetical protein